MNTKVCLRCKKDFDRANFHKRNGESDGLSTWCKPCSKEYAAGYYKKNSRKMKDMARIRDLRVNFNISMEFYESMFRGQNGGCAICKKQNTDGRRLHVDHDHKTGRIRGLLCYRCNSGLGYFKDSKENLS